MWSAWCCRCFWLVRIEVETDEDDGSGPEDTLGDRTQLLIKGDAVEWERDGEDECPKVCARVRMIDLDSREISMKKKKKKKDRGKHTFQP